MASFTRRTLLPRWRLRRPTLRAVAAVAVVLAALIVALPPGLVRSDGGGGVNVTVIPFVPGTLEVAIVSVEPPGPLQSGDRFRVTAVVSNNGGEQLRRGQATLHFDTTGLSLVDEEGAPDFIGQQTRNLGALGAGREKTVRWNLVADQNGTYVLLVEASAVRRSDGGDVTATGTGSWTIIVQPVLSAAGASGAAPGPAVTPEGVVPRRGSGAPGAIPTPAGGGGR